MFMDPRHTNVATLLRAESAAFCTSFPTTLLMPLMQRVSGRMSRWLRATRLAIASLQHRIEENWLQCLPLTRPPAVPWFELEARESQSEPSPMHRQRLRTLQLTKIIVCPHPEHLKQVPVPPLAGNQAKHTKGTLTIVMHALHEVPHRSHSRHGFTA
jgi:hypothetical protein